MRLSQNFTKTRKEVPADETAKNGQLLIRAGYIHKEMAGVYTYLPLGLKVLNNVSKIIREEMDAIGGQEIFLTTLQRKELWEMSGRWSDEVVDVWFKTALKNGTELGLGWTHEEPAAEAMKQFVNSYKDLPVFTYQFQNKFRNEIRSKSGIMRTREFIMKDGYSFSRTQEEHDEFYEKAKQAYIKIFERAGIGESTYLTFASGGSFSKYSHEFQTICDAGEDTIYVHEGRKLAINEEVYTDEVLAELDLKKEDLKEIKASEVGNIFGLGTMHTLTNTPRITFTDEDGNENPAVMGSYGIGPARLMGVITELMADDKGLVWPTNIAPARVHIVRLEDDEEVVKAADDLYESLKAKGIEAIYDDRDMRFGEKMADADLMGVPVRVVISKKTVAENKIEFKERTSEETEMISVEELHERLSK